MCVANTNVQSPVILSNVVTETTYTPPPGYKTWEDFFCSEVGGTPENGFYGVAKELDVTAMEELQKIYKESLNHAHSESMKLRTNFQVAGLSGNFYPGNLTDLYHNFANGSYREYHGIADNLSNTVRVRAEEYRGWLHGIRYGKSNHWTTSTTWMDHDNATNWTNAWNQRFPHALEKIDNVEKKLNDWVKFKEHELGEEWKRLAVFKDKHFDVELNKGIDSKALQNIFSLKDKV